MLRRFVSRTRDATARSCTASASGSARATSSIVCVAASGVCSSWDAFAAKRCEAEKDRSTGLLKGVNVYRSALTDPAATGAR